MNYVITYAILGTVAVILARAERRRRAKLGRAALERALAADPQPPYTQDQADADLEAVARAIRDQPYAPGRERIATAADQPVPYLPAEISDFEQWQAELEDQR